MTAAMETAFFLEALDGPVKDEEFDLDDLLDLDYALAGEDGPVTPNAPASKAAFSRVEAPGLASSPPVHAQYASPSQGTSFILSSAASMRQERFRGTKRECLDSAAVYTPPSSMSSGEYVEKMSFRCIASAADRPPLPPKPKQAKSRTKSGCFTCRKRRIKCDERLPHCRNCEKSKKDCGGYDPKNLPEPDDWNSLPDRRSTSAISNFGAEHPSSLPAQPSSPLISSKRKQSAEFAAISKKLKRNISSDSSDSSDPRFEYPGVNASSMSAASGAQPGGAPYNAAFANSLNVQTSTINQDLSLGTPTAQAPSLWSEAHSRIEKQRELRIEDLYLMGGADPPTPRIEEPIPEETMQEIKELYTHEYAKGMDAFMETTWYSEHGLAHLLQDGRLLEMFAGMVEVFRTTASTDFEVQHRLPSTEARVVWMLLCLARKAAGSSSDDVPVTPAERSELTYIIARIAIFEHLVTNKTLSPNPHMFSGQQMNYSSTQQSRQHRFWMLLGHVVSLRGDNAGRVAADAALNSLRSLLDGQENRDVLYSIAIVRHLGSRTPDFPDKLVPGALSIGLSVDDKKRLVVAKKFLEDEASEGTYQVVQRMCGMARRAWTWRS